MTVAVHPKGSTSWKPIIPQPMNSGKVFMIDQAHHNYHRILETTGGEVGTLKGLQDTLEADGYTCRINYDLFTKENLEGVDSLFITSACSDWYMAADEEGGKDYTNASNACKPAFTDEEVVVVKDWVNAGGNLLLVFDHTPFGPANQTLASAFGATLPSQIAPIRFGSFWNFNYGKDALAKHPIFQGRNSDEAITSLTNFQMSHCYWPGSQSLFKYPQFSYRLDISPDGWDLFWHSAFTYLEKNTIPLRMIPALIAASNRVDISSQPALSYKIYNKVADNGRVLIVGEQSKFTTSWQGTSGMHDPTTFKLALNMLRWVGGDI